MCFIWFRKNHTISCGLIGLREEENSSMESFQFRVSCLSWAHWTYWLLPLWQPCDAKKPFGCVSNTMDSQDETWQHGSWASKYPLSKLRIWFLRCVYIPFPSPHFCHRLKVGSLTSASRCCILWCPCLHLNQITLLARNPSEKHALLLEDIVPLVVRILRVCGFRSHINVLCM